jgi:hypothetical protein
VSVESATVYIFTISPDVAEEVSTGLWSSRALGEIEE